MARRDRLLDRILRGTSDANIPFADLCRLLHRLGFDERIRSSHRIFTKGGVEEILNLQPTFLLTVLNEGVAVADDLGLANERQFDHNGRQRDL